MKPTVRPSTSCFGSGPTAKRPGWSPAVLSGALLGRSHRSAPAKARLGELLERSRALLGLPEEHRIALVAGLRHRRLRDGDVVPPRRARHRPARLGELRRGLADRRARPVEAPGPADPARRVRRLPDLARCRPNATRCSPGTAPPRACACRTATGSPTGARGSRSAMRPRPRSPSTCPGTSSMSRPTPGRRCWAARRSTACWCWGRARSSGSRATGRPGRCRSSSA